MDVVKNLNKRSYYGRVKSRNLSEEKISFLKNYVISNKITQDIFLRKNLIIEIGFGSGENILELSRKFKNKTFIGIEPYLTGACNLAKIIHEKKIRNVFIYPYVYEKFIEEFPNFTFNELFILHPDPWPKKKHKKRRLINTNFLKLFIDKSRVNSTIYITTDNLNYRNEILDMCVELKNKIKIIKSIKKIVKTKYFLKAMNKGVNSNLITLKKKLIV